MKLNKKSKKLLITLFISSLVIGGSIFGPKIVKAAIQFNGGEYTNLCGSGPDATSYSCEANCNPSTGFCRGTGDVTVAKYVCNDAKKNDCRDNESWSTEADMGSPRCNTTVQLDVFDKKCRGDDGSWNCVRENLKGYMTWYSGACATPTPTDRPTPTPTRRVTPTPTIPQNLSCIIELQRPENNPLTAQRILTKATANVNPNSLGFDKVSCGILNRTTGQRSTTSTENANKFNFCPFNHLTPSTSYTVNATYFSSSNPSKKVECSNAFTTLARVVPTPTPTDVPSITPTPTDVPNNNVQCPSGFVRTISGSNIICIQQVQNQEQNQSVTQVVNTQGGNASTGEVRVIVENPAAGGEVLGDTIVTEGKTPVIVESLPKTGLPIAAWALSGFLPAGFGIRRFAKGLKDNKDTASFIWSLRQFSKDN